jgi:5-methylcytosine-specific restriction endonuclease McrA
MTIRLPSVIALKDFVKGSRKPPFTRYNVFLRDRFQCQYCTEFFTMDELTLDHVIPRSKGGLSTWDNVVTCCKTCNLKKSNFLPHEIKMHPLHDPIEPSKTELHRISREATNKYFHDSWRDFLT